MSYCPNASCPEYHKLILSSFCRKCGTQTKRDICTYCQHEILDSSDKFCGFCGRPLDITKE